MSWSNSWVGRRAGIIAAMARYSDTLTLNSKEEFEAARPHLEALIDLNSNGAGDPVLIIDASGHAYRDHHNERNCYCQVSVNLRTVGALCEEPEQPGDVAALNRIAGVPT